MKKQAEGAARNRFAFCLAAVLTLGIASFCHASAQEPPIAAVEMDRVLLFSSMTDGLFQGESLMGVDPNKPMLALTFDDGPGPYTNELLEILSANGARATFFMIGRNIDAYWEAAQSVVQRGNQIGTHTWSHPDLRDVDTATISEQLAWSIDAIYDVVDHPVLLMRPPYGGVNDDVRAVCRDMGLSIIRWSVDTQDWQTKDADATTDAILQEARDGSIILCHDAVPSTIDAMYTVIPELVRRGFQLVTVSELFESRGMPLEPGVVYYQYTNEEG